MTHKNIIDAARVAWIDALSHLPHPFSEATNNIERGTIPTHVTVVAFKGGVDTADAMPNSVLSFLPTSSIETTYKTTVRTIGLPLFAMAGNAKSTTAGAVAGSPRAIFLPFKTHGLLIYPISPRGNQDTIRSTIKAVTTAFDLPDPAGMITLCNFNVPVSRFADRVFTASGVLNAILEFSWNVFSDGMPMSTYSSTARERNIAMREMYEYAEYSGIEALRQTTFDGTVNSVFGSILCAALALSFRKDAEGEAAASHHLYTTGQAKHIYEVFDTCFAKEFFNQQDPWRFVPRSTLAGLVRGAQEVAPRHAGGPLPALNTVNLIADQVNGGHFASSVNLIADKVNSGFDNMPYSYTINTMSVPEVDVLATSKLILSAHTPSTTATSNHAARIFDPCGSQTAMRALQGAMVVDLAAISSENLRRAIGDYCFVLFGYRAESHRDIRKDSEAVIVLFHICDTDPHAKHKREVGVTAIYAMLPTLLNSVKDPAITLGKFAEKVAAAIKSARIVLSRATLSGGMRRSTSGRPEQFSVSMDIIGTSFGANAVEGLIMAKAFLLLGGSVRANIRDSAVAIGGDMNTSSVSIDNSNQLELGHAVVQCVPDSDNDVLTLTANDSIVTSLRMFV